MRHIAQPPAAAVGLMQQAHRWQLLLQAPTSGLSFVDTIYKAARQAHAGDIPTKSPPLGNSRDPSKELEAHAWVELYVPKVCNPALSQLCHVLLFALTALSLVSACGARQLCRT